MSRDTLFLSILARHSRAGIVRTRRMWIISIENSRLDYILTSYLTRKKQMAPLHLFTPSHHNNIEVYYGVPSPNILCSQPQMVIPARAHLVARPACCFHKYILIPTLGARARLPSLAFGRALRVPARVPGIYATAT